MPELSRIEQLRRRERDAGNQAWIEYMPEMPHIAAAGHVITYLFEVGPSMAGDAGPLPLTHQEIAAWRANSGGMPLTPWESMALRRLSCEYVGQWHQSKNRKCPEPMLDAMSEDERAAKAKAAASKALRDEMRAMAR